MINEASSTIKLATAERIFSTLVANTSRLFASLELVMIKNKTAAHHVAYTPSGVTKNLHNILRKTDVLFEIAPNCWGILFMNSHELDATAFVSRIFKMDYFAHDPAHFVVCSMEIRNDSVLFSNVIATGLNAINAADLPHQSYTIIHDFKAIKVATVKISIITANPLFAQALSLALTNIQVDHFELEIRQFEDGSSFLSSDWYYSANKHIVLLDDILPRQNGMEVLYYIRRLPNNRKFTTLMMSNRQSEDHAVLAYKNGVDLYLTKPLNHQLLIALITRTLQRLWD